MVRVRFDVLFTGFVRSVNALHNYKAQLESLLRAINSEMAMRSRVRRAVDARNNTEVLRTGFATVHLPHTAVGERQRRD